MSHAHHAQVSELLEHLGGQDNTVSCVFNLIDTLAQIKLLPMFIFLDNNLSDGERLEKIGELKARSPFTKIAFITASTDLKIKEQTFIRGVDYFLAKPFQGVLKFCRKCSKRKQNLILHFH